MRSSAPKAPSSARPESFQLKGGLFPMNLLEVKTLELADIQSELEDKIKKAPAFFENAPLVLGFEMLNDELHERFDLAGLIALCKDLHLYPAASRGCNGALQQKSIELQLATLAKGREKHVGVATDMPSSKQSPEAALEPPAAANTAVASIAQASNTKIITTPIRSGQQIYAPGGDLIVMSSVSAGAEVLADGNIHIYGALRGRALAGVKGDEKARIFCISQEAELLSIAGHFLVDDQLKSTHWKESVQILTADDSIVIRPLL